MRVHLEQVEEQPVRWAEQRSIDVQELDWEDLLEIGEIDWRGEIVHAPPGFLLRASMSYEQTLACTRCLSPKTEQLNNDIELLLIVDPEGPTELEKELDESDLGVVSLSEEYYETEPLFWEQIQLNLPMRTLCKSDCEGLCDGCGANLNKGPCDCERDETDSRWSALQDLKNRLP